MRLGGLHHLSAITADAGSNLTFYTRVLGLRLVKKTVNQDDTTSYHLFYADGEGTPGTEVTFFDIPYAAPTVPGRQSISAFSLRVPDETSLTYFADRLSRAGVVHAGVVRLGGRATLPFRDPEGQNVALVADPEGGAPCPVPGGPVPVAHAVSGLGPVTLTVGDLAPTGRLLTQVMGFEDRGAFSDGAREVRVFGLAGAGLAGEVHVRVAPELPPARLGRGGVHHVAFRVADDAQHRAWLSRLEEFGIRTSGLIDRFYFRSIYFREPGGVLFELATDGPGFTADEPLATLGEHLSLPPFLEGRRKEIEAALTPITPAPDPLAGGS